MARTPIPITHVGETPVNVPAEVVSDPNGHELAYNDGRVFLVVRNTSGGVLGFSLLTQGKVGELDIKDPALNAPASSTIILGPFNPRVYNWQDGKVLIGTSTANLRFRAYHTN